MRIAAISDLHLDINRRFPVVDTLSKILDEEKADVLLIAGDIEEDFREVIKRVKDIEKISGVRTYYVPGNHDLWSPNAHLYNIDYIYSAFKDDERCLVGKTINIKSCSIVGDVGWYDYSFGNYKRFSYDMFDKMTYMARTWQDSIKNAWTRDNIKRNEIMLDSLKTQIEKTESANIIAVTHMLPIKEFTVLDAREEWEYFNAFLGSEKLGALFETSKVKHSISGHVHYRKRLEKNGVDYICPCLGYYTEWRYKKGMEEDLYYHIKASLMMIEI